MKNTSLENTPLLWIEDRAITGKDLLEAICMEKLQVTITKELILNDRLKEIALNTKDQEQIILDFRKQNSLIDNEKYLSYLDSNKINEEVLIRFLQRPKKINIFKEERWGPRVNALYLKNKDKYDKMTYFKLESINSDVMQEVYFRLKDKEETWESMARQFPGSIKAKNGPTEVQEIDQGLVKEMRRAGVDRIVKPLKIKNIYVIAELIKIEHTKLDSKLKERILEDEFTNWLKLETSKLLKKTRIAS